MSHKPGWRHQLRWRHTHRVPPNGLPIVLGEWTDREPTTEDFLSVYPDYKLGCGFCHAIEFPYQPVKRRDPEVNRIANARRKATLEANRARKHYPLLANVLIAEHGLDWRAEEDIKRLRDDVNRPALAKRWNDHTPAIGGTKQIGMRANDCD